LHFRSVTGIVYELATSNPPIGIFNAHAFDSSRAQFSSGDIAVLLTDGLTEVMDSREAAWLPSRRFSASTINLGRQGFISASASEASEAAQRFMSESDVAVFQHGLSRWANAQVTVRENRTATRVRLLALHYYLAAAIPSRETNYDLQILERASRAIGPQTSGELHS